MTTLDFTETMKVLMPNLKLKESTRSIDFYKVKLFYDGSKVKISGKIPYEVAMRIFENYPCEQLGIRVGFVGNGVCPINFLTDDMFEMERNRSYKNEEVRARSRRLDKERERMEKRPNEIKYIPVYRVSTKEGLIVLLHEIEKYYAKANVVLEDSRVTEATIAVNVRVVDKINPRLSIREWMMSTINSSEYFRGWNRFKSTPALSEFRRAVEVFDRVVNPFLEGDLSTEEIVRDLSGTEIAAYPFSYTDEYRDAHSYYEIVINDRVGESKVNFSRNPGGFSYCAVCTLGEKEFLMVNHSYCVDDEVESCGEILSIKYFGDNSPIQKSVRLNLTNGTVGEREQRKKKVSSMQLSSIYLDLVKATKAAAVVTINNFEKNKAIQL